MAITSIRIGSFYELPDGRIARPYGWNGASGTASYSCGDGSEPEVISGAELLATWTERPDLDDFPNVTNAKLPYDFDLHWDIKRRSQLPELLATTDDPGMVRAVMQRHGIALTAEEEVQIAAARPDAEQAGGGFRP